METLKKDPFQNYRAFSRKSCEVPILYALHNTDRYYTAKMYNSSTAGMYFESAHNGLRRGADICIRMADYKAQVHGPEIRNGYRAEVRWCSKIAKEEGGPCYGFGVRFMVNTCDFCGITVAYSDIHKTDHLIFLCPSCFSKLEELAGEEKIKESIENYLMGNVY
jgi:hypothetical protein